MHSVPQRKPVRTLFVSDIHMGMRGAQVDALLAFLETFEPQTIYLVGDIVDGWRLKKSWYWPPACNRVVQTLLEKLRDGVRIVYVPGNHDDFLRAFGQSKFGGIDVRDEAIHVAADGRRYLVIHGDQYDVAVRHARWFSKLGDISYNAALRSAMAINRVRQRFGWPHWSLSAWARENVGRAAALVTRFETVLSRAAIEAGADGVICGHIHSAAIHERYGTAYLNCGDWVENCTALAELPDGRFELIRWLDLRDATAREHADAAAFDRL